LRILEADQGECYETSDAVGAHGLALPAAGLTVTSPRGSTVFADPLEGGLAIKNSIHDVAIPSQLEPSPAVTSGSASPHFNFSGAAIARGSSGVQGASSIPEPGTLGLLGTGLIVLAGVVRKLKIGT